MYFREVLAEGGGGHTFETAILGALLTRIGGDPGFCFLGPEGAMLDRVRSEGHQAVPIAVSGGRRMVLKTPTAWGFIHSFFTPPMGRMTAPTRLDRLVSDAGLDFLWCLGPDVPSLETPFAMTVWDLQHRLQPFFPEVSRGGTWEARERYYAACLRRAALVITGTQVGRDELTRFYQLSKERIVVLPHPAPAWPESERPDQEVLSTHAIEPGYLFYPAQFWPHKNHVGLLEALARLGTDAPVLVLTGSDHGGNRRHVEAAIRQRGLDTKVRVLGFVPRVDLPALYRNALALTYVSYFGPENLPPLEAFSQRCPVIAARVPGSVDQLGEAALLVDPNDPDEIAGAVRAVTNEGTREELVTRGEQRAAQRTSEGFVEGALAAIHRFEPIRRNWPSGDAL